MTTLGDYAYVAQQGQLEVLDISDPVNPVSIGALPIGSNPKAIRAQGNFLYVVDVASPNSSLQIIDISTPAMAKLVKSIGVTGIVLDFDVEGGYAYLVNQSQMLVVPLPTAGSFFPIYDLLGNVSGYADSNVAAQTVDTFSLSGNNLLLSLSGDGEPNQSVNLTGFLDNTDNQTLSLNGTTLSLTNGGSVSLSAFSGDNLGNHTATQNLRLNGKWLSTDGASSGLFLDGSNNVGIGTATPAGKLHVFSTTNPLVTIKSDAGTTLILDRGATGSENAVQFRTSGTDSWLVGMDNAPSANASNFSIKVANNGNADFLIKTNGNVGIGSTDPVEKLQVGGAIKLGSTTSSNAGSIRWTGSDFEGFDGQAWKSLTSSIVGEVDALYGGAPANGTPILDARQTSGGVTISINQGAGRWQSFTAEQTGVLSKIEIQHAQSYNFIEDGLLRIYAGEGTSGALLHEQQIDDGNTNGYFATYTLSPPVSVVAGTQYTFWLVNNSGSHDLQYSSSNPYAGGIYNGDPTRDLKFNTYVIPRTLLIGMDDTGSISISNGNVFIDADGNMGINTNAPASKLHVKDNFADYSKFVMTVENTGNASGSGGLLVQAGQNSWSGNTRFIQFNRPDGTQIGKISQDASNSVFYAATSDERLKTRIVSTAYGLSDLMGIDVRDYRFKDDLEHPQTGFIAQQLHEHYPPAVTVGGDDEKTDPWQVDYGKLTPLLVRSVQELKETVDDQARQLQTQRKEIERLKAEKSSVQSRLEKIEAKLERTIP
ncbi:MAG: tail fiber domain-containing protein [Prosthecobacter sp.]|nr:tail fiber domain-containing protein [Prosthecobacter sp.]